MELKKIKILGMVILAAAFVSGCGHSSSNNNANPYWYGSQYGAFGINGANSAYAGMGAGGSPQEGEAMILLNLSGGTGELEVVSPIYCMGNPSLSLPQGVYQLTPQSGQASGTVGLNLTFMASGPTQAIVQVPTAAILTTAPMCGFNGLTGDFNVAEVAGYSCISADIGITSQGMGQVQTGYSCQ